MMKFWKKSLVIVPVVTVLTTSCNTSLAQKSNALSNRGISSIVVKRRELTVGDNWHSRSLDVKTASRNIGRYDAIGCAQLVVQHNRQVWQFLRQSKPSQTMFYYISADTSRKGNESTYLNYDYINTRHPEWFLLADIRNATLQHYKDRNKRIRYAPFDPNSSNYDRFYIDVGNADFQKWATDQILDMVSGSTQRLAHPYDGLSMDNVHIGTRRWSKLNRRYPNWKYGGNPEAWHNAFFSYLKSVKRELNKHGFILVINHSMVRMWTGNIGLFFWTVLMVFRLNNLLGRVWDLIIEGKNGFVA